MRRSTTTPLRSSRSARRVSTPRRSSPRGRRRTASSLTPRQVREAGGIMLAGGALLATAVLVAGSGPGAQALRGAVMGAFGAGWPIPLAATLAGGVYLIWPGSGTLRPLDVGAAAVATVSLVGLLSLAAGAGGGTGSAVSRLLVAFVGPWGAGVALVASLILGLIVAFHFSPGAVLAAVTAAVRAAHAERERLNALARPRSKPHPDSAPAAIPGEFQSKPSPVPAVVPQAGPVEAPLALPTRAARLDRESNPPDEDASEPAVTPSVAAEPAAIRVVADPFDDEPEVDWKLPPISLLDSVTARKERMQDEIKRNVRIIEHTLATFGVQARVVGVNPGPAVTQYELQPAAGVQVKRITALHNDLSLALAASPLRVEAPIPGKSAVGLEVPNRSASLVSLREVVESSAFKSASLHLALALGNDVSGHSVVGDLTRMPHLLIAGATGQGKSVCINAMLSSLLLQATPRDLRLILVDPKRVELSGYNGLPHLAVPVIVEPHQASAALRWAVAEMDRRYKLLSGEGVRNIQGYNERAAARAARPLPYVVIVIDELADLMMVAAGEIEELVCRIAQLARAVGIHLLIATQRPSTDIITGLIKANIPSRIAFAVGSQVDSRVILDSGGAEKLLGRGDMLYQPVDAGKPTRIQGAFVSDGEVEALVRFWQAQGEPRFMEEVLDDQQAGEWEGGASERKLDPLFARAARAVTAEGAASVSLVQRKFNVGYSRAGRIVDQLAEHRVIGGYQGSKSREVLMNLPDVDELLERIGVE